MKNQIVEMADEGVPSKASGWRETVDPSLWVWVRLLENADIGQRWLHLRGGRSRAANVRGRRLGKPSRSCTSMSQEKNDRSDLLMKLAFRKFDSCLFHQGIEEFDD